MIKTKNMLEGKKIYLTKKGEKEIKEELAKLLRTRELKSKKDVPSVLHSEELNTEFLAFREDLEFLELKIKELEYILKNYELIKTPPRKDRDKVQIGAQVKVEVDGQEDEFMIVGTVEANPTAGRISNESPVGRAFLNHKVGDEVIISSPVKVIYKIKAIKY